METVELEALKIGVQYAISEEFLSAGVEAWQEMLYGRIVIAIRGYVWAEKESVRRQQIKYPRDWWQAFKERWFPKWMLAKFPVDYHVVYIDVRAIYPTFKQALPQHAAILVINRQDGFTSWDAKL